MTNEGLMKKIKRDYAKKNSRQSAALVNRPEVPILIDEEEEEPEIQATVMRDPEPKVIQGEGERRG